MEKPVEEYIRATFSFLRVLKESERSRTMLAAKEDGKLVVVREIYATGLPYKEIKAIEHPLFAKIFLTAEEDGRTWIVEEYIDGENLQEIWERGERFSAAEIKAMLREMSEGLAALHRAGIVHRDIKPAHILRQGGRLRLIDFDAARLMREDAAPDTRHLGTVGYAPPEQYGYGQTDGRSDIYALGVTFEKLLQDGEGGAVRRVLRRAQAVDPAARYASIESLMAAIHRWHCLYLLKSIGSIGIFGIFVLSPFFLYFPHEKEQSIIQEEKIPAEENQEMVDEIAEKETDTPEIIENELPLNVDSPQPAVSKDVFQDGHRAKKERGLNFLRADGNLAVECLWCGESHKSSGAIMISRRALGAPVMEGKAPVPSDWSVGLRITNEGNAPLQQPRLLLHTTFAGAENLTVRGPEMILPGETADIIVPLGQYEFSFPGGSETREYIDISLFDALERDRPLAYWNHTICIAPYSPEYIYEHVYKVNHGYRKP